MDQAVKGLPLIVQGLEQVHFTKVFQKCLLKRDAMNARYHKSVGAHFHLFNLEGIIQGNKFSTIQDVFNDVVVSRFLDQVAGEVGLHTAQGYHAFCKHITHTHAALGRVVFHDTGSRPVSGYFLGSILGREIAHIRIALLVDHFTIQKDAHVHPAQFQGIGDGKFLPPDANCFVNLVQRHALIGSGHGAPGLHALVPDFDTVDERQAIGQPAVHDREHTVTHGPFFFNSWPFHRVLHIKRRRFSSQKHESRKHEKEQWLSFQIAHQG